MVLIHIHNLYLQPYPNHVAANSLNDTVPRHFGSINMYYSPTKFPYPIFLYGFVVVTVYSLGTRYMNKR